MNLYGLLSYDIKEIYKLNVTWMLRKSLKIEKKLRFQVFKKLKKKKKHMKMKKKIRQITTIPIFLSRLLKLKERERKRLEKIASRNKEPERKEASELGLFIVFGGGAMVIIIIYKICKFIIRTLFF